MKRVIVFAAAIFVLASVPRRADATTISAPFVTVGVGDTVIIPISIADAVDLTSWQFDLGFAPTTVVNADSVSEGPFMSNFGTTVFTPGVIDNGSGLISLVAGLYVDLPPNPSGSGVLANIQFHALAPGVSPLRFSNVFLNLSDRGFDILNGQITVTGSGGGPGGPSPVPEPATLALTASGIVMFARRRRAALLCLVALLGAAPAARAQTVSPGPYYATPSWDQKLACDSAANCPRFVVLANWNNEAVLDRETGLVWERAPLTFCGGLFCAAPETGTKTYSNALFHCASRVIGSRAGWRLPKFEELRALIDFDPSNLASPQLPPAHPFVGIRPTLYWTSTPDPPPSSFIRVVDFTNQPLFGKNTSMTSLNPLTEAFVWCVRGGAGPDVQ